VEAYFLVLPLALFAFRGFSVGPATASLNAPAAVEIISLPASTVALAASVTTSCADFATSTLAFAASVSACSVEVRTPSPSLSIDISPSIVGPLPKKLALSVTSRFAHGQSQPARKPVEDLSCRIPCAGVQRPFDPARWSSRAPRLRRPVETHGHLLGLNPSRQLVGSLVENDPRAKFSTDESQV
jgi:hypothetical protein